MAKYDQGGGCACGLQRICDCGLGQGDGKPSFKRSMTFSPHPLYRPGYARLFCDMDGVAADFDTGYRAIFGKARERHSGWDDIRSVPNFYRHLPEMSDWQALWAVIRPHDPIFLTGTPMSVNMAGNDKIEWIYEHASPGVGVICCKSKEKRRYCRPGDILIDDTPEYRKLWEEVGGIWVPHVSARHTIEQLRELGIK